MSVRHDLRYGAHPEQTGDLHLPAGAPPRRGVVLWHGGSFLPQYTRGMMAPLAARLAAQGLAVYNATYRRLDCGGGVPETFDDALAAVEHLVREVDLDEAPMGVGLSAGAPLALHAALEGRLSRVVDIAGIACLERAARIPGVEVVPRLFGATPDEAPGLYARFDPLARGRLGVPALVLHGDADDVVPLLVSELYAERSGAELVVVGGGDHYGLHGEAGDPPPELLRFLA